MALSKVVKVGNGITNQFAVSFELGYINESDITAQVGGEVDGLGDPLYRNITFLSPELLQIDGAIPGNGVNIEFVRTVPSNILLVDYEDGDIINDENLNTSQKQAIMLIHQLLDGRFENFNAGFDMGGFIISGLGAPVNPNDAVRKVYVDDLVGGTVVARDAAIAAATLSGTYAGNSAASAADSLVAKNDAEAASALAVSIYDQFDDRYLGSKTANPTVDNDGNALVVGALYYRSTAPVGMKVWDGANWTSTTSVVTAITSPSLFTATASQTVFPIAGGYDPGNALVFLNGAKQENGTDVVLTSGTNVVFTTPCSVNDRVEVVAFTSVQISNALDKLQSGLDIPSLPTWRSNTSRKVVSVKTGNYTIVPDDIGNTIVNTGAGAWTLSLPAAATAGNGFYFEFRNPLGGSKITVDPNGAELVNAASTLGVYGGDSVELVCDGTAWHALFQSNESVILTEQLAVARSVVDMPLPSEFRHFNLLLEGFEPTVIAGLGMRLSIDSGASYYSNSGAYFWQQGYDNGGSGSSAIYSSASAGTSWNSTAIEISAGAQAAQNGVLNLIDIKFNVRGVSRIPGVLWNGAFGAGYANRGQGQLGVSTADLTNARLLYSAGNIGSGARYTLRGRR